MLDQLEYSKTNKTPILTIDDSPKQAKHQSLQGDTLVKGVNHAQTASCPSITGDYSLIITVFPVAFVGLFCVVLIKLQAIITSIADSGLKISYWSWPVSFRWISVLMPLCLTRLSSHQSPSPRINFLKLVAQ